MTWSRKIVGTLVALLLIGMIECEEPISLDSGPGTERLIVEGMITDEPGPYTVTLSTTAAYAFGSEGVNLFFDGAEITIFDSEGNSELLRQVSPGTYQTSAFGIIGVIGRSYWIQIVTPRGTEFVSDPEPMVSGPIMDDLYAEFVEQTDFNLAGHQVYIDIEDPPESRNFFRYEWDGLYQYSSLGDVAVLCPTTCWQTESGKAPVDGGVGINTLSDLRVNGNRITKHPIVLVPYFSRDQYIVRVKQFILTQGAFEYWEVLQNQLENTGGVFDTPPANINGNIKNKTNPEIPAIGYFGASSVQTEFLTIDRFGLPIRPPHFRPYLGWPNTVCCAELMGSTVEKPEGWP